MSKQKIIICNNLKNDLEEAILSHKYDKLFILTDNHTFCQCLPVIQEIDQVKNATHITIGVEDVNKTLETLAYVWLKLSNGGATRHSLIINLGGGMVTDLGGFAAATFKRGIQFINIPTTLLSMVDAAVGGKTGINFNGLKNEIGAFAPASEVIIDSVFLKTSDYENIISGYAEMLKHGLISTEDNWKELIKFDFDKDIDYKSLQELIGKSVEIKENIVEQDPNEKGIRKALNLGHTIGHAFESFALKTEHPVLHGYAVAWGLVCELYLSHVKLNFPKEKLRQTVTFIKEHYGKLNFSCKDYDTLYEFMTHDKKNESSGSINFTLLSNIGEIKINQTVSKEDIFESLDFYSETMG
ncbi:3-dehydroquinate synthase [uncultured Bacteroides sp.]|uniref:3-dehydroquinate synthase n=1 Tax=uncultured Bacteroides sp. TaxID=162156 RepID=UPI0026140802|nr:3-dehydroquinate synthase [uncultured Bacteroides sp.]